MSSTQKLNQIEFQKCFFWVDFEFINSYMLDYSIKQTDMQTVWLHDHRPLHKKGSMHKYLVFLDSQPWVFKLLKKMFFKTNLFISSCIYLLLLFAFQWHCSQYDNTTQTGIVSQGLCRCFCNGLVHSKKQYSYQDCLNLYYKSDPVFPRSHFVSSGCRSLASQHWTPSLRWHLDPDWPVLEQAGWWLNLSVLWRLHHTWCEAVTQSLPHLEPSCSRSGRYKSQKSRGTHR